MYGVLLHVAFDLHRFDMLSGMHHKLPETVDEEHAQAKEVAEIFDPRRGPHSAVESWPNIRYSHPSTKDESEQANTT
jgi:hypothetical protein